MNVSFRPHWLLTLTLPLVLIACGSSEPDQRATFKQFLQTRIVDKPGVHVPHPTADESKAFGEYAAQYTVITDFTSEMDAGVKPLDGLVQKMAIHSLNDVMTHRDDLKTVQSALSDMGQQLKQSQAKADSAHAQLKQPEDLKAVYDQAYDRVVSVPATTFLEVLPQVNSTLDSIKKLGDYVDAHKAQIVVNGSQIQVQDPKVLAELNTQLQGLNSQAKIAQQAQSRLQSVMLGP